MNDKQGDKQKAEFFANKLAKTFSDENNDRFCKNTKKLVEDYFEQDKIEIDYKKMKNLPNLLASEDWTRPFKSLTLKLQSIKLVSQIKS